MFSFFGFFKNSESKQKQENRLESKIDTKTEELPFFGTIIMSNAKDYEVEGININGNNVSIDLNFELDEITSKTLQSVRTILSNIENIEKDVKNQIRQYVDQPGMVNEYYKFHIEEIDSQTLHDYLQDTDQNLPTEFRLFSKTKLKRIGFFPDSVKFTVVFDYRVLNEYSDDILVVILDENGEIEKITVES